MDTAKASMLNAIARRNTSTTSVIQVKEGLIKPVIPATAGENVSDPFFTFSVPVFERD
jgi:hypothetical protein